MSTFFYRLCKYVCGVLRWYAVSAAYLQKSSGIDQEYQPQNLVKFVSPFSTAFSGLCVSHGSPLPVPLEEEVSKLL